MESKGLRVNMKKTKFLISGVGLNLLQDSGEFPWPPDLPKWPLTFSCTCLMDHLCQCIKIGSSNFQNCVHKFHNRWTIGWVGHIMSPANLAWQRHNKLIESHRQITKYITQALCVKCINQWIHAALSKLWICTVHCREYASNALPLPTSRRWSPLTSPFNQAFS